MQITAYVHPFRMNRKTTGVGKHMINMVTCLNQQPDVRVSLLASAAHISADGKIDCDLPVRDMPTTAVAGSRWKTEMTWALLNRPDVSALATGADWLYCPCEVFVPAKHIPMAMTVHCVNWFENQLPWYNKPAIRRERFRMGIKWRPMLRKSRVIFAVSHFLKSRIVELFGVPDEKIVVVGNGVEKEYFDAGRSTEPILPHDRPYIMVVGGLTARKGAPQVLEVARKLQATDPEVELIVPGINEPEFVEQARDLRNIRLIGHETAATISSLMRGSIALMFLSRYETFGIPAVEAMAAGTPAIVSNWAALPEIVGDAGLILQSGRSDEAVDLVRQLRRDNGFRNSQIQAGLKHVQQFTWENCAKRALAGLKPV